MRYLKIKLCKQYSRHALEPEEKRTAVSINLIESKAHLKEETRMMNSKHQSHYMLVEQLVTVSFTSETKKNETKICQQRLFAALLESRVLEHSLSLLITSFENFLDFVVHLRSESDFQARFAFISIGKKRKFFSILVQIESIRVRFHSFSVSLTLFLWIAFKIADFQFQLIEMILGISCYGY